MRSSFSQKTRVILIALIGLAAIVILAMGLRDVSFRTGEIMGQREAEAVSLPLVRIMQDISNIPIWKQLVAWAIVFLIVLIGTLILSPASRWRLIKMFLRISAVFAAIYFLASNFPDIFKGLALLKPEDAPQAQVASGEGLPPPVFEPPQISPTTVFLIALGISLTLAVIFWAIRRWWLRRQGFLAMRRPVDELAGIARQSLGMIQSGGSWDDAILESYVRMSAVIEKRQGLVRHHAMTPTEFALGLERAGLPGDAVHTLTHLFEGVRYGARHSSSDEIDQAVSCLQAILKYCGESR